MRVSRALIASAAIATAIARDVAAIRQPTTQMDTRVLRVTKTADDGSEGTLRWAIASSNGTPERERIAIEVRCPLLELREVLDCFQRSLRAKQPLNVNAA